jgi:hypothetical protein
VIEPGTSALSVLPDVHTRDSFERLSQVSAGVPPDTDSLERKGTRDKRGMKVLAGGLSVPKAARKDQKGLIRTERAAQLWPRAGSGRRETGPVARWTRDGARGGLILREPAGNRE